MPDKVNKPVLGEVEATFQLAAAKLMDNIMNSVAPGGQDEIKGLTVYIRIPQSDHSAEEVRKHNKDLCHRQEDWHSTCTLQT